MNRLADKTGSPLGLPAIDCRLATADCRMPNADSRFPIADWPATKQPAQMAIGNWQSPISNESTCVERSQLLLPSTFRHDRRSLCS